MSKLKNNIFFGTIFIAVILVSIQGYVFLPFYWHDIFLPIGPVICCFCTCYLSYMLHFRLCCPQYSRLIVWVPAIIWGLIIFIFSVMSNEIPLMLDGETFMTILIFIVILPAAFLRFYQLYISVKSIEGEKLNSAQVKHH